MRKNICDLHTHSYYSDGTYSPTQLVDEAVQMGLSAIALCDHNSIEGLEEFLSAARGRDIDAVCGCEFSCDYGERELHILGLFIKPCHFGKVRALTDELLLRKEESNILLVKNLNKAGYKLDYEKIKRENTGIINRAHIAGELMRLGYVNSIKEAFKNLLSKKGGYFIQPKRLDVFKTIDFINSIGALSVLAHPFLNVNEEELRAFLNTAKEHGLTAMETMYGAYDKNTEQLSRKIAKEYALYESGGSDFHGERKPDIFIGIGKGQLCVTNEIYEKLKEKAR